MKFSKKVTLCLLCLFIFVFKIAAADMFVNKALDRAETINFLQKIDNPGANSSSLVKHINADLKLSLMSHVVGNFSRYKSSKFFLSEASPARDPFIEPLISSDIRDLIYKPPKA